MLHGALLRQRRARGSACHDSARMAAVSTCPSCSAPIGDVRCAACGAASRAGAYRVLSVLAESPHGRTYRAQGPTGVVSAGPSRQEEPVDPLLIYRERFPILAGTNYLISNSLGAAPAAVGPSLSGRSVACFLAASAACEARTRLSRRRWVSWQHAAVLTRFDAVADGLLEHASETGTSMVTVESHLSLTVSRGSRGA